MNASLNPLGIDKLSVEERLALVKAIWDSIAADGAVKPLTKAQHIELQKRIYEDDDRLHDVAPGDLVKSSTLTRPRK